MADGLAAIHALDVVHRDLKPSNILFDAQGRAKIADLGLAQVPGGPSMRSRLSQSAPHPGTPAYMSPEQINTSEHLSPASDVYALGAVLFEVLTGRLLRNIKPGTPAQSLRADTPEWLDELLVKMLTKDYEARPLGWRGGHGSDSPAQVASLHMRQQRRRTERASRKSAAKAKRETEEKAQREAELRQQQPLKTDSNRDAVPPKPKRREQAARQRINVDAGPRRDHGLCARARRRVPDG